MNNLGRIPSKLLAGVTVLVITLLAACTPSSTVTFCHATGDATKPYEEITGIAVELKEHLDHPNDFLPAPANGCPTNLVVVSDGKISICHASGNKTDPYNEITVSVNGLNGHGNHIDDILPVPEGGCPANLVVSDDAISICHATGDTEVPYEKLSVTSAQLTEHSNHPTDIYPAPANGCPTSLVVISNGKISICHATGRETNPYDEITVSVNDLNGHDTHKGDIVPAPEVGCPTSPLVVTDYKITICHTAGIESNSYNEITVNINGMNGHGQHANDIFPVPEGGCPVNPVVVSDGKITICHATSSTNNPYNEITVSVNGLNGHSKHSGDIIPAPEGGCPTTKQ
ncbi:MAG TPA: hypothetical protein VJZ78_00880 [Anaerolineales bacterium]|nr:hypothetical protein [Anaerolineales bacterium]